MNKIQLLIGLALCFTAILFSAREARADCTWTVAGTVKVQTQESLLSGKFGAQIPLKGIKVKVSGATVGSIFDSWGEVSTDANGKFSISKQKSCEDRKLKIQVQFQNNNVEIRDNKTLGLVPNVPWYTIVEDSEKRRKPGLNQILPTVFAAGKPQDLNDTTARHHADIWVIANTLRDHLAGYGAQFKYLKQSEIKYPNNELIAPDSNEASFTHPVTHVVNVFRSSDGTNDHMAPGSGVDTLFHEMMHAWAFEHVHGELDLAFNLITSFDTHCSNNEQHVSHHEAFAEFAMERLKEEIFGSTHTLPFNRDALKEGLSCSGNVDRINTMALLEKHEFGWMSLFRMLTTDQLGQFTYAGEANSTSRFNSSVFISRAPTVALGCSNVTNFKLKNILDVFLSHSSKGFSNNLTKSEMKDIDTYLHRAARILGFEDKEAALKNLLDPTKTTEPKDELCGVEKKTLPPDSIRPPRKRP
jgi:hypothetical protein